MKRIALSSLGVLLGLAFLLPPAWAAVNRDQAAAIAQRAVPGRVLAIEHGVSMDNSVVWRVKVLTAAGEVRDIVIDATTGKAR